MQPQTKGRMKKAMALAMGITASFTAASHEDYILEACPNLKDGAVKTAIIKSDFSLKTAEWNMAFSIDGQITVENTTEVRDELLFSNEENHNDLPNLLIVNSSGGNSVAANNIVSAMNATNNTITLCANQASSAALSILSNGVNRYAQDSCMGVIHNFSVEKSVWESTVDTIYFWSEENKREERFREHLDSIDKRILTKSGFMDEKCYNTLTQNGDIYLTAKDMLKLGIVDAVLLPDNKMEVHATGDYRVALQACTNPAENKYLNIADPTEEDQQTFIDAAQACYDQHAPAL